MWKPVTENKVAVAIWTYRKSQENDLSLKIGDVVCLSESIDGWYRGHVPPNKTVTGIFPASHVHRKEQSSNQGESLEDTDSLIEELDCVLKEWHSVLTDRFKTNEMLWFSELRKVMLELIDLRRQLMSGQLTQEPAREVKIQITNRIDVGNERMGLDLIPSIDGKIIDTNTCSIVDLHQVHLQSVAQTAKVLPVVMDAGWLLAVKSAGIDISPPSQIRVEGMAAFAHHIHLQLKNFGCSIGEEAEAFFALYDAKESRFISERYLAKFNKLGVPNNIDRIGNLCTIFSELSNKDIVRELYLTCHIIRKGAMLTTKKATSNFRRPYGCGVVSLLTVLSEPVDDVSSTAKEFVMKIVQGSSEAEFSQLHDNIIRKHMNKLGASSTTNIGISLSLRMLHGHFDQLKREMPLLFSKGVTITRKLGFSDVIMPGDVRNDLYLMLDRAELERGKKTAGKNVEVTVHVIDGNNKKMKCISLGGDEDEVDEYRSAIFYHTNQPRWNENIRLSIPMEKFKDTHIRLECRHCSATRGDRNLFAMAFMRLMKEDGTTVEDSEHELFVYKCAENQDFENPLYLNLPSCTQEMVTRSSPAFGNNVFSRNMRETFFIRTIICSTKLAQNVLLLDLLKWRAHPDNLKETLHHLTKVGGQEIVRVLQDILDALFNILDEKAHHYEKDVFDALVYILGILGDTRFKSFTTVLDTYIDKFFSSTQAHMFLVKQLKRYVDDSVTERAETVIATLKAVQNLFKFIFRSHVLYKKATGDLHDGNIQDSMRCLFASMNKLMSHTEDKVKLHQLILLKNFSMIATELRVMYNAAEVAQFIIELLEHMPRKALTPEILKAKLVFISETIKSNLFKDSSSRFFLLEPCTKQLKYHIENKNELVTCVDILGSILSNLHNISKTESVDSDVSILVKHLFESILDLVMSLDKKTGVLCITCLLHLLHFMKESHYEEVRSSFVDGERHRDFLKKVLKVFKDLASRNIYPSEWLAMKMLSQSVILNATRRISVDLSSTFLNAENVNVQLWFDYFRLACIFITQPCLQFETMTHAKQERMMSRHGDMRVDMAQEIVSKWQSLGDYKSLFRDLTRPFLEVTMVRQADIRRLILPIIFDIMCCEKLERGTFGQLEDDLIDKLDTMVCVEKKGDENYAVLFNQVLLECIASQPWREEGEQFVDKVKRLLERLIDYRNVSDGRVENRHLRLNCLYNLMNFYKDDANREDIYTRYIYRLRDLHLESQDYTEAAFTLMVLAKSQDWTDKMLPPDDKHPKQTEMKRKEALYHEIIRLLDKGEMWEFGIPLCKELTTQYEGKLFDYEKNSRILQTQASFFDNILKKQRQPPTYFRIMFYGNFPLKSKSWIYRGRPFDQLSTIQNQLQADFPRAKKWINSDPPGSADLRDNTQYIQIRALETVPTDNIFKDMKVPIQISSYYDSHNISKFKFDRPFNKGEKDPNNEFKTLWVEQTTLKTENTFPSLLRWADVISTETVEITPIQNAVGVMESKNKSIRSMIAEMYANPDRNINPLSMNLQGTIDAAVQGGPKKYKIAFLSPEYKKAHPEDGDLCLTLEKLLMDQLKILKEGVDLHERLCPDDLADFQKNLATKLVELRRYFGLTPVTARVGSNPTTPTGKSRTNTASGIFTYKRATVVGQPKSSSSGKTSSISEEPAGTSKFYLDGITETNSQVSPSQDGRKAGSSSIKKGRATIAVPRYLPLNSETGSKTKLQVKKSDSSSSIPDRSSTASLQSPDFQETGSPRSLTPTDKHLKSPHKDNLLRENYKGPTLPPRYSNGSRPNSSGSVTSSSSTTSSRDDAGAAVDDPNAPPALPERKPATQVDSSSPRSILIDAAKPLPHELPENGDTSPPPPLPTKKISIGGANPIASSRRRTGYDQAPPAIPIKNRSHSISSTVNRLSDGDYSPRSSLGEGDEAPPPIPSRPEKRSLTSPLSMDVAPLSPSQHSPIPLSPGLLTLEPIPSSPPPPSIPPPELPETLPAQVEKLAGELKTESNGRLKVPPPVPTRPKSRRGSTPNPEPSDIV
ncbi:dedicator of cytokinesis protein 3-like isoform X1 [Asterias amurensis]|uniref:dedicator of cytokinesis protein 3-like isoform X1 n=1 Tax=Asterias amurensis TaxID=7602 RepID=UPI003AB524EA